MLLMCQNKRTTQGAINVDYYDASFDPVPMMTKNIVTLIFSFRVWPIWTGDCWFKIFDSGGIRTHATEVTGA